LPRPRLALSSAAWETANDKQRFLVPCSLFALSVRGWGRCAERPESTAFRLSGSELRTGMCNQVRYSSVQPRSKATHGCSAVVRESGGNLIWQGARRDFDRGAEQALSIPVRTTPPCDGCLCLAGDAAETQLGLNAEGACSA
jgi:hypothetical protein